MKYPKEYINEIKLRLKVSQIVGKSVQLKKRGKEFIGLSPFKNEKTPSFTVNDDKEFYHCFSTGEHGNIFDFLMKTKSMTFGEAVKILAAEAGMQPYRFSNFDEKKEKRFLTYKNIIEDYKNYFHYNLSKSNNKEAFSYLTQRGLDKNIIEKFKLGYVPWKNNFYEVLLKKYSEEEINLTGLYYKNDKSQKYIDRFNSRIIFPVNNISGDTIAFGGRIIKESKLAKYINSPETEFYKKGKIIFNLDNAKVKRGKTNSVIIVEGYMDVVSLYSKGIENVISNSGTALTENQIDLIWKFFSEPIICLDGDESGQKAALRIAERLFCQINENNKIFFSVMPKGKDPDEFVKLKGKESFLKLLEEKKIIQTYIWDLYSNKINKSDPYAITKFEKDIKKLCYSIKDETIKKYILEDFLNKIRELTPMQNFKYRKNLIPKNEFKILNATKKLHKETNQFSKEELIEFSIIYVFLNFLQISSENINKLSNLNFSNEQVSNLRDEIIKIQKIEGDFKNTKVNINKKFDSLIAEIEKNSYLKNIIQKKNDNQKEELFNDLLNDHNEVNQLKQIEFLEKKFAKNLDESSYSELIKLKSQLNRE